MDLVTLLPRLPLLPVKGVIRLAELIGEEAEAQLRDPGQVKAELAEAQRLHEAGEISGEELAWRQRDALGRLTAGGETAGADGAGEAPDPVAAPGSGAERRPRPRARAPVVRRSSPGRRGRRPRG
jgi:hypothetical protein